MSPSFGRLFSAHRHGAIVHDRLQAATPSLGLDQADCIAGTVISGHVAPCDDATVALLRHERVPHGDYVFTVAEARPSPSDGTFALSLPDQMLPSATGQRCELRYIVGAHATTEQLARRSSSRRARAPTWPATRLPPSDC